MSDRAPTGARPSEDAPRSYDCDRCGKPGATVEFVQAGSHWWFHPGCESVMPLPTSMRDDLDDGDSLYSPRLPSAEDSGARVPPELARVAEKLLMNIVHHARQNEWVAYVSPSEQATLRALASVLRAAAPSPDETSDPMEDL